MLGCGLYIEHNPAKASIVKKPEEYQWSSYRHWLGLGRNDFLVGEHPLQNVMGDYQGIAEDYIDTYLTYERGTKIRI